jgi:hypothetical protein
VMQLGLALFSIPHRQPGGPGRQLSKRMRQLKQLTTHFHNLGVYFQNPTI